MLAIAATCLLLSVLLAGIPAWADQDTKLESNSKYQGRVIASIQFDPSLQPLSPDELQKRLSLHPGSVFSEVSVRQAIQNLFASGRYSDIAVDAAEAGDKVALRFLTKPAYFVGRILITGFKQPPNYGQLASATKLQLGSAYLDAKKSQAVESIHEVLLQNGFYHAQIETRVAFNNSTESADLIFRVKPGDRARFTEPIVTGLPERTLPGIVRSTHWKRLYGLLGWQDLTEARLRQGLDRLRRDYEKRDRLQSTVILTKLDYDSESKHRSALAVPRSRSGNRRYGGGRQHRPP